jgi:hypothetical protein
MPGKELSLECEMHFGLNVPDRRLYWGPRTVDGNPVLPVRELLTEPAVKIDAVTRAVWCRENPQHVGPKYTHGRF